MADLYGATETLTSAGKRFEDGSGKIVSGWEQRQMIRRRWNMIEQKIDLIEEGDRKVDYM